MPENTAFRTRPVTRPRKRVVAITGAANFLGQRLIAALNEHPEVERVVAIDINSVEVEHEKFRFYKVDLSLPNTGSLLTKIFTKEGVDSLMHLIFAFSLARRSSLAHELEAIGTMHLLDACAASGVKKMVLRSSGLVYGARPENPLFLPETAPLMPTVKTFVADKIEAERQIKQFVERHAEVSTVVLREGTVLGPHARNHFIELLKRSMVPKIMGHDPLMQFIHEDDLVDYYLAALFKNVEGTYNLVAPGVLRFSEVLDICHRKTVAIPETFLRIHAALLWTLQLNNVSADLIPYLKYPMIMDGSKAEYVLEVRPRYTSRSAVAACASLL